MVYWLSVLLFFLLTYLLGYSVSFFTKKSGLIEGAVMRVGLGLCVFVVLIYVFGVLGIPLYIVYFLIVSAVVPVFLLVRRLVRQKSFRFKGHDGRLVLKKGQVVMVLLFIIFVVTLYMYMKGSFAYPYLEDGDPYWHADAATFIMVRHTFVHADALDFAYLPPYPPAYSSMMGILAQSNGDVVWTLKFFNALIISLSVLWFFFFARAFMGSSVLALFSTFVLASLPAYLSHFIFAHALGVSLFSVGFYMLVMCSGDRKWAVPLFVAGSALLLVQATVSIVFGIFSAVLFAGACVRERRFVWSVAVGLGSALVFALGIFWVPDMLVHGGLQGIVTSGSGEKLWSIGLEDSSNKFVYTAADFLITKKYGGIDTQLGIGLFASILVLFGVLYLFYSLFASRHARGRLVKEDAWVLVAFVLLVIAFLGIEGGRLPVRLVPLRWWAFFSFPFALFAAYSISRLSGLGRSKPFRNIVVLVLVVGIVWTSFFSRYAVQTSMCVWTSMDELQGYLNLKDTSYNGIMPMCSVDGKLHFIGKRSYLVNGPESDRQYVEFRETAFNQTPADVASFLRSNRLGYVLFDVSCVKDFGVNETNLMLEAYENSSYFQGVFSAPGVFLFGVV
ncbi:hypothetical protein KY363_04655 [Candidatus Woesearchaeota archaeon]|nr:hypothetical protein [Candidatus Woesearchaeota archaeon]